MSLTPVISLRGVTREFRSGEHTLRALDSVDLDIYSSEFVAIIGQSGSGKTTLMNIIGCLDRPSRGEYLVEGLAVGSLDDDQLARLRSATFGFIFQKYNLLATASAQENVELPGLYCSVSREQRSQRAVHLLTQLGLGDRLYHRPAQLSGGQQQRVAVARALMNDPHVLLADEPTGALDTRSGEEVLRVLEDLHRQGRTLILITHDERIAQRAQRIIRLEDGCIVEDTNPGQQVPLRETQFSPRQNLIGSHSKTDIPAALRTALRSLRTNVFRTSLTLLGIVIGVAAVIAMLAIGNGSKQRVLQEIRNLGTNLVSIRPGAPGLRSTGEVVTLTLEDAQALKEVAGIDVVVPERSGSKTFRYDNIDYMSSVQAVGSDYPHARDWPLDEGTFFSERDILSFAPVVVLGKTLARTLFPLDQNPLGSYVLIGTTPFEVIGVMAEKGAAPWGTDQDDVAFVPITTGLIRLFGGRHLSGVTVKVFSTDGIPQIISEIEQILLLRHGKIDFQVRNTSAYLEMATQTQNTLTTLLGAVAAISLFVGGIGVMNIMLVSVTERTREIGIRMAVGARVRDILLQFNAEATVVCIIGGVVGIALGCGVVAVVRLFGISSMYSLGPILVAFFSAVATGIVFGYLPARKAAKLDPVVALASE